MEGRLDASLTRVAIDGAVVSSTEGVVIRVEQVEVQHTWGVPTWVSLKALSVRATMDQVRALMPRLQGPPVSVSQGELEIQGVALLGDRPATIRFAYAERGGERVEVKDLSLGVDSPKLRFQAPSVVIDEHRGSVPSARLSLAQHVPIDVEALDLDRASQRISWSFAAAKEATCELAVDQRLLMMKFDRMPKERFMSLGFQPPGSVSGHVRVVLDSKTISNVDISFDLSLEGFVPPHPRELNGIVFGNQTQSKGEGHLELLPQLRGNLADLELTAGALTLRGTGLLDSGGVHVSLHGTIGCAELATSAVSAHLGFGIGMRTSPVGRKLLSGTVGVVVQANAPWGELATPRVSVSANNRCRVRVPW